MKKDILKIAGVKSEKEFYKKYPTEAAFMKAHKKEFKKAAMGAAMVNKQLTQLTDFSNPPKAQVGKVVGGIPPQYQVQVYNPYAANTNNAATYNKQTGMFNSPTGQVSMADTKSFGINNSGNKTFKQTANDLTGSDIQSGVQMTSIVGSNIQKIDNAAKQQKQAKQLSALAPVVLKAQESRKKYEPQKITRPEDIAYGTQDVGQANGTSYGNQFIAANGTMIGGNPTEIQNMYNPGDIYSDMGYEPLSDSDIVKQYRTGGLVARAQDGASSGGPKGGGEIVGLVAEGLNSIGDITAGIMNAKTDKLNKQSQQILGQGAFQSGMQGLQENQYNAFMKDGGWVSHDWQPQVITQFGGYDMKDLLRDDETMDTLRSGGHIAQVGYTTPSARAMSTERAAFGGQLSLDGPGKIEMMGYNPITAASGASGEIGISRGPSHSAQDRGAADNMIMNYAGNDVNIEGGETIMQKSDGGQIDPSTGAPDASAHVLGDMKPILYTDALLDGVNDKLIKKLEKGKNLKDMKFKHIGNEVAKLTGNLNKKESKYLDLLNEDKGRLENQTATVALQGIKMQYKDLDALQNNLTGLQNAYHDAAKQYGYEDTPKFLDLIKKDKLKLMPQEEPTYQAKFGAKMETAQDGVEAKWDEFEKAAIDRLKAIYPNRKVSIKHESTGVYNKSGGRDIETQKNILRKGNSKTAVSLHNFDAAKDYNIYVDDKLVKARRNKELYANVLWNAAKETGLYHVGSKENNWDPRHIGLVQEGVGTSFNKLYENYPEIFRNPTSKKSLAWITEHKNDSTELKKLYGYITGIVNSKGEKLPENTLMDKPFGEPAIASNKKYSPAGNAIIDLPMIGDANGMYNDPVYVNEASMLPEIIIKGRKSAAKPDVAVDQAAPPQTSVAQNVAQTSVPQGSYIPSYADRWNQYLPTQTPGASFPYASIESGKSAAASNTVPVDPAMETSKKLDLATIYNMVSPYTRPLLQNPVDPSLLAGPMFQLATNQEDPVFTQSYQPMLKTTPAKLSPQDMLNENQATFNALSRQIGNNPAALATLAQQKYTADQNAISKIQMYNQQQQIGTNNENIENLNKAQLTNQERYSQQAYLKSLAKSNTKAQTYEALTSIGDIIARNKKETLAARIQSSMSPQVQIGPNGRVTTTGLAQFNIPQLASYSSQDLQKLLDAKKVEESKSPKLTRNGSIVKAIKNL